MRALECRAAAVLAAAALGGALLGLAFGQDAVDQLVYRGSSSRERRVHALERLLARGHGVGLLEAAIRDEDGSLHDRALELAPDFLLRADLGDALRARIERRDREPSLEDLRVAAALADERALPGLMERMRTTARRPRAAAFTAFAAIVARRRVPPSRLPPLEWGERWILGELALGLEEDSAPWRGDCLRALAANMRASPVVVARLRAQLRDVEGDRELVDRAVLWLRGDPLSLRHVVPELRDRVGLLAPLDALRGRVDASFLDAVLALDQWGGAGDWRWLEAARRELLVAALTRAEDRARPAARAAALLVSQAAARAAGRAAREDPPPLGGVEDAPPPLLAGFGPDDVPAIVQAAGRPDGRLVRVLEPGAGDPRERFLLDLAVAALSTNARSGR